MIEYMQIRRLAMHIFDYSFLDKGLFPAEIVNLTSTISAFNAREKKKTEVYIQN